MRAGGRQKEAGSGGLGRTGSSRDCPRDRGSRGPGEGQRLSTEAPHSRSEIGSPLSKPWGRKPGGEGLKAEWAHATQWGVRPAGSGLGALGAPAHIQACRPLSWGPVNTKGHTSPKDVRHKRRASVGHSCGRHWPGYLGRGQGVCLQPGRESE